MHLFAACAPPLFDRKPQACALALLETADLHSTAGSNPLPGNPNTFACGFGSNEPFLWNPEMT